MVEHIIDFIIFLLGKLGYAGTFGGMLLESACIPIPSEIVLPFGGYLSSSSAPLGHKLNLIMVIVFATLGGLVGSILAYAIGAKGGRVLVYKYASTLHLSKEKIEKSESVFAKYGDKIIFISRLLPIIRTFISLPAGIAKMNFAKFAIYTFIGSAIWSTVLVYAGFVMGKNWQVIRSYFHIADYFVAGAIILFIVYSIVVYIKKKKKNK
ncbi:MULTISPECIES: DedA family protein [Clostridium]|uniref:DedA family protein n=1 Tax=Clostridium TaxID=1485 RepID=UPI000824088E|nr:MULTISPECIES: DedA family protein [Clostridium]PJI09461.1 DedA family protein [Clostridium sp. CT7]